MYAAHEAFPDERYEGYAIIWDMVNSTWLDFLRAIFQDLIIYTLASGPVNTKNITIYDFFFSIGSWNRAASGQHNMNCYYTIFIIIHIIIVFHIIFSHFLTMNTNVRIYRIQCANVNTCTPHFSMYECIHNMYIYYVLRSLCSIICTPQIHFNNWF